ncbi:MAG: hypothetical protein ABJK25_09585 [Halieaceae bacterium]
MKRLIKLVRVVLVSLVMVSLYGCDDPQIYGSVGVSSGYSNYGYGRGGWGSGVHTSISVGGRIR